MKRLYDKIIEDHYENYTEMLFLVGPRQVGKTTSSVSTGEEQNHLYYFNWDDDDDRLKIISGAGNIAKEIGLTKAHKKRPIIIFDEIHKYKRWKKFLKGFYDKYGKYACILVTGSARMDVYRKGGDSLMGRYFPFRMHPFSVAEIINPTPPDEEIRKQPTEIDEAQWNHLVQFGGFPKPFLHATKKFYNRWKTLRHQLLFREDLRDLTRVQELGQMEILAEFIRQQATQLVGYASLSKMVRVSADTVRRWTKILRSMYFHFELRPWSKNVTRSLIKEPKFYLWDWALIDDPGSRFENLLASHLLKATHFWTDSGFGQFDLYFIRDKDKREVDFIVIKNDQPWILIEAKVSHKQLLSPHLSRFQEQLKSPHALQVAMDMDYVDVNCFGYKKPIIVPAKTFLSQLV